MIRWTDVLSWSTHAHFLHDKTFTHVGCVRDTAGREPRQRRSRYRFVAESYYSSARYTVTTRHRSLQAAKRAVAKRVEYVWLSNVR